MKVESIRDLLFNMDPRVHQDLK